MIHQFSVKGFDDELTMINEALTTLRESTSGAKKSTYSFLQIQQKSMMTSRQQQAGMDVLALVQDLARKEGTASLLTLASRIKSLVRFGGGNQVDVFGQVKELIEGLLAKLIQEKNEEASKKEYCDEKLPKGERQLEVNEAAQRRAQLRFDDAKITVADREKELKDEKKKRDEVSLAIAAMEEERTKEKAEFGKVKEDLNYGIAGVNKAIKLLTEYYAEEAPSDVAEQTPPPIEFDEPTSPDEPPKYKKSSEGGNAITTVLGEVLEAFQKDLAAKEAEEQEDVTDYLELKQKLETEEITANGHITAVEDELTQEKKTLTEMTVDRDRAVQEYTSAQASLDADRKYCTIFPETYEEKKRRLESELAGLKKARAILKAATEIQISVRRLRGNRA